MTKLLNQPRLPNHPPKARLPNHPPPKARLPNHPPKARPPNHLNQTLTKKKKRFLIFGMKIVFQINVINTLILFLSGIVNFLRPK